VQNLASICDRPHSTLRRSGFEVKQTYLKSKECNRSANDCPPQIWYRPFPQLWELKLLGGKIGLRQGGVTRSEFHIKCIKQCLCLQRHNGRLLVIEQFGRMMWPNLIWETDSKFLNSDCVPQLTDLRLTDCVLHQADCSIPRITPCRDRISSLYISS